jgi:hypothetical protein
MEISEAGGFSAEFYLRNVLNALQTPSTFLEISKILYACILSLSAVGDLAYLSLPAEKFSVTGGGFTEEQRLELFEQLRIRDLIARLDAFSADDVISSSTIVLIDLLWSLAAARVVCPGIQERLLLEISSRKDASENPKYFWARAMLCRDFPKIENIKNFNDTDLINISFAAIAASDLEISSRLALELAPRLATLKTYQLHYALRFFAFSKGLANLEIPKLAEAAFESLKGKKEVARRPQWKQAMQVSLATHGVFGSSVEVAPSLAGIFPIDAMHAKSGIAIEVDRPLNFFRDVNARVIRADAYLEMSRRLIALKGVGNLGPLRLVNVRLSQWTAVPPGDISAQIKFMRELLKPVRFPRE